MNFVSILSIGNLIADASNGVKEITRTVYGKIASNYKTNNEFITSKYDAAGNRIYKDELKGGDLKRTWYVRDTQGNALAIYDQAPGAAAPSLQEQHLYGSRLGL